MLFNETQDELEANNPIKIELLLDGIFGTSEDKLWLNGKEETDNVILITDESENDQKEESKGGIETYLDLFTEANHTENTNDEKYICNECHKVFRAKHTLKRHLLIHFPIRNYQCPQCNKGFQRNFCLKRHIRVHTGERPHICPHCNRAFADRSNLIAHVKIHFGVPQRKPRDKANKKRSGYICNICNCRFGVRERASRHIRTYHKGMAVKDCLTKIKKSINDKEDTDER